MKTLLVFERQRKGGGGRAKQSYWSVFIGYAAIRSSGGDVLLIVIIFFVFFLFKGY